MQLVSFKPGSRSESVKDLCVVKAVRIIMIDELACAK